jgi:tetratricopeptide (TPR) repeat protein
MSEEPLLSPSPFAKLLRDLEDPNASLEQVLEQLRGPRPAGADEMLRRAAVPRHFDRALYDKVLCAIPPAAPMPFDEFIALPEVQPLPRDSGFIVARETRDRLLPEWRRQPTEWIDWNARLASYLQSKGSSEAADCLYHLVVAKSSEAVTFGDTQFLEAETSYNMARCYALLSVLDDLQSELGPELAAVRLRWQQRYRARALFANDYYRTGTYQQRTRPLSSFEEVRQSSEQWVLHLHATGGMGKTMFLRWLLARYLVPSGVACARVDFDEVNVPSVARFPWLLLIPMCMALNEQLPTTYFSELIDKLEPFEPLLHAPGRRTEARLAVDFLPDQTGDIYVRQFASSLRQSGSEIIVVLDTIESITLADQFGPVFAMFSAIHETAPQMRLVVSGRYNVAVRLDALANELASSEAGDILATDSAKAAADAHALAERFRQASVITELSPFLREEARAYLEVRKVRPDIVDAILEKVRRPAEERKPGKETAEGNAEEGWNPFTLALFVELVLGRDEITAADIRAFPSVHYVYMLERVVKRIPEQSLRWVVRYGALPRRLTEDYIANVLLDPLQQALRGELCADIPREQYRAGQKIVEQDIWFAEPTTTVSTGSLWRDLCRYEAPRGWIRRVLGSDTVVQFHSDVVDPMRDLLSSQAMYPKLQLASISYYSRLAQEQPSQWAEWMAEAIFHRFQMEGDQAAAFWIETLQSPGANVDPIVRRRIAREVLSHEYAEDETRPRTRGEPPRELISTSTLARAHAETAKAILDQFGYVNTGDAEWPELTRHVRLAIQLGGAAAIAPDIVASIQASELAGKADRDAAVQTLSKAFAEVTDPAARFRLALQLAERADELRDPSVPDLYQEAIRLHPGQGLTGISPAEVRLRLATWYDTEGRLLEAQESYKDAYAASAGDLDMSNRVSLRVAWSALRTGDYPGAAETLDRARSNVPRSSPYFQALERLDAWRWVYLEEPRRALEFAERALQGARSSADEAHAHDLLAYIHVQLLQFSDAASHWDNAVHIFTRLATVNAVESCVIDQVTMRLQVMGDASEANRLIVESERLPGMRDHELLVRLRLQKTILQTRAGDLAGAHETLKDLEAGHAQQWPPFLRVRVAATALALGLTPPADDALQHLWDLLDKVRPPFARLDLVECFRECRNPLTNSPDWRKRFVDLFPRPTEMAFAAIALKTADVYRVFGEADSVKRDLSLALSSLRANRNPWGQLRAIYALQSLGVTDEEALFGPSFGDEAVNAQFAEAVLDLERAMARLRAGRDAKDLVLRAAPVITREPTLTRWHAAAYEAQAQIARLKGDWKATARETNAAVKAYTSIGDLAGADRVRREMPVPASIQSGQAPSLARRRTIRQVDVSGFLFSRTEEIDSISELLLAGEPIIRQMRSALISQEELDILSDPGIEVCFEGITGLGAALPLEWMLPDRFVFRSRRAPEGVSTQTTLSIQMMLLRLGFGVAVDGLYGPKTVEKLKEFAKSVGLNPDFPLEPEILRELALSSASIKPARVLLVQPFGSGYDASEATSQSITGIAVESLYQSFAPIPSVFNSPSVVVALEVLEEPDAKTLEEALVRIQPNVIHIVCAVKASRGIAYLDFARRSRGTAEVFTAQALARVLRSAQEMYRPVVILDVARPDSEWEAVSALMLRNQFASDLFASESTPAVIASGLAGYQDKFDVTSTLVAAVRTSTSSRRLMEVLRQFDPQPGNELDRLLAHTGAALFTNEPEMPVYFS